jgi:Toc86/159 family protein import component
VIEDSPEKGQNAEDQAAASEAPEESTNMDADLEDEAAKAQPSSETSTVVSGHPQSDFVSYSVDASDDKQMTTNLNGAPIQVVNAGSAEEPSPAGTDIVIEDSLEKEQNAEEQAATSEAVEDAEEVENGAAAPELAAEASNGNNGADETKGATEVAVADHEEEAGVSDIIEAEAVADVEDGVGNEADDDDDDDDDRANSDTSPARVAILESSEAAKQIMKELAEGSSSGLVSGSRDFTESMDGQIMLDDSEDDDDDEEDGDEKGFDSAALAALLKAATGGSSDGNITVASQDGSRIFTMDRPAGLGSSAASLRPTAPRQPARSNPFSPSELAVTADPTEEMTEEEKKLHDKVELIRVKFLRLVYRLGATPEETVAAQVLYRLSLAEGIRHGRQTNRAFSLDNARRKALLLEAEGKEDLDFSCNILVLGKIGVGKSATINSIFGEEKTRTDAFSSATTNVREIVGVVDGVKIRIIDTPGLRPNVMDQGSNRKVLSAVKKFTKKCPPDIVLYVDRLDSLSRDLNDLPLLKTITAVLGSSIWFNAIVALTHAASAPPEGLNGAPMTYEVLMAQRSHIIQQSIRQAAGDMRLMNPVALVENHPSCRRNREGQKVLPNGQSWRHQMLLLCYSSKILSEANSLLKLQDPNPGKLFGFRFRSPPLPFLLSSLLQSRAHPKLSAEQGGNEGDSDIELDDYSDVEQDDDEEEYDQLPPFKPLTKAQLLRLTKEQKNAYFDEYDYRVKLLQKKQWKDEIRRLKEMKKRGKTDMDDDYGYANITGENDQDPPPENVSVPLPDMVLPPSFDCDNPTYRYRFLEPTSTVLARPVLDAHGWDHDCGYDGVSVEETLAILSRFPANVAVQVTKDKKEFSIHLDSSIAAKHGDNASSLAGFDIQTVGRQLAYILRGETKIKNIKKNKTTGGFSVTFLGDIVATGLKVEDQLSLGKRLSLVASTGMMRAQGDTAYGANLEARLKDKDYPIGQSLSTLGLSLMKWRRDLALGANLQSQFSIGRGSKMAVRLGLNNKLSGQITVRTSTSEQVQIALVGLVPVLASIYRSFRPSEPSFAY